MRRNILWAVLLTAAVMAAPAARADYEAGQRAWDAGRPDAPLTEWRSAAAGGDRRAMLALGRLFVKGLGAPQKVVTEGHYKDDERHGRWRFVREGLVEEGPYKDDKKHGRWVTRWSDGTVTETLYVDGR